ncbi:MAG TPA: ATP synthase F1 subunit epsilon [Gemmataceae bacterium]|jgi:F-type H+-transporting ATPase subunit epsilon|nr:ATP synthase F1 subunit epsilon [Gemmataceae bacterium]
MDAGQRSLQCVVVTPERAVLDEPVDFVVLPLYDGELGVLPGRAPLIGRLGPGELRLRRGDAIRRFFVDGGFAQVRNNIVTVLTPRAVRGEDINTQAATQMLEAPSTPAASLEERVAQQKNQQRARAQLRVARRTRGEV